MNLFRRLKIAFGIANASPLEVASRELVQAQLDLLGAEAWREHFTGQTATLRGRITRLRAAVSDLSQEPQS